MVKAICTLINYMTIVDKLKQDFSVKNIRSTNKIEAKILDSKPKIVLANFLVNYKTNAIKLTRNASLF